MKAVGLITEYNPIHNGHVYHLQRAVELTNADVSIAVMSGNFVQRGEPAFLDKYQRCKAAIDAGVNLVIELPVTYALSSAEGFADGAVRMLSALGVDAVVFGSESGNLPLLQTAAHVIATEPATYQLALKKALADGNSFPLARQMAILSYFSNPDKNEVTTNESNDSICDLMSSPNNILAIEYLKAIKKNNCSITPFTIQRQGLGYHDIDLDNNPDNDSNTKLPSASAIRASFHPGQSQDVLLSQRVPATMHQTLIEQFRVSYPVVLNDFTQQLNYKLSSIFYECSFQKNVIADHLCTYTDVTAGLANRIFECFTGQETFYDFAMRLKTRQYTFSRICRCLLHIVLNLRTDEYEKYFQSQVPYIRILGFDDLGRQYLSQIKKSCPVPVITKTAGHQDLLKEDIYAAALYNQVVFQKYQTILSDEFRSGIYRKLNR